MKIIFSRKGFDSSAGGFPSIIFDNGSLYSIPIPSKFDNDFYADININYQNDSIQKILNDITNQTINSGKKIKCDYGDCKIKMHNDPFISDNLMALGQIGNSAGHLRSHKISKGDIFLFYGWFRQVEKINGIWQYKNNSKNIHHIWSYMFIDDVLDIGKNQNNAIKIILSKYPELSKHPHLKYKEKNNILYISKKGNFGKLNYKSARCLTDMEDYEGRSKWILPIYFNQKDNWTFLNNFCNKNEFFCNVIFRGYGQEFILDAKLFNEEIINYVRHNILI